MASATIRDGRFPVGQSVSVYAAAAKRPDAAPSGSSVAGPFTVAADGSLTVTGLSDGVRYTAYALVNSVNTYVDFMPDPYREAIRESFEDERRRMWFPGGALVDTMPRSDVVSGAVPLTSGTLLVAGGVLLPAKKTVSRISIISGTTAGATLTHSWASLIRQSDLVTLASSADDTTASLAANTLKEFALSAPYTPTDDTPVYVGIMFAGTTPPSLAGVVLNNAAVAGALTSNILCGTSSTGLTTPIAVGTAVGALTATANLAYAIVR